MKPGTRRTLFQFHSWIGLAACLFFALLGLTGTLIVYQREIEAIGLPPVQPSVDPPRDVSALIAAATAAVPGTATFIDFPRAPGEPAKVSIGGAVEMTVLVDPWRAEVMGSHGPTWLDTAYALHDSLAIGDVGRSILGIVGIGGVVVLITGAWLWWPGRRRLIKSLKVRWRSRWWIVMYDLHKSGGAIGLVVLAVVTVTGIYFCYYAPIQQGLVAMRAMEPYPFELPSGPADAAAISPDAAVAAALARVPDGKVSYMRLAVAPEDPFIVTIRRPGQVARDGLTRIWVDQWTGRVLKHRDPSRFSAADHTLAWMFPLHNGEAFGAVGRAIVALSGLVMFGLGASGAIMWWRRPRRTSARIAKAA